MEQLTLDQAAENHGIHDKSPVGSRLYIYKTEAFKAGAEWQKEQLKAKWDAMSNIMENGLAKDLVDRVAAQLLQD